MLVTHEEGDTVIVDQIVKEKAAKVLVVADVTDVCILLCHFVFSGDITGHILIESPIKGRALIDINQSVDGNLKIMYNILATHGIWLCHCGTILWHRKRSCFAGFECTKALS